MKEKLENERIQLLHHWTNRLILNPDWTADKLYQVEMAFEASNGDAEAQNKLADRLRLFHDKLGFMAKGSCLCAGAIFRTSAFIDVDAKQRRGSKIERSIHIEHTFPISQLKAEIIKARFPDYLATLTWLLKHSVATAFYEK
jgi:hypothetical protein